MATRPTATPSAGPSNARGGAASPSRPNRGGIVVRTIQRSQGSSSGGPKTRLRAAEASAAQEARRRARSRPSKRYRERLEGADRPGGAFSREPESAKQYEEGVIEIYDPNLVNNASSRKLSLREQRERDGAAFALPLLSRLCLEVIADSFSTHILPLKYDQRAVVPRTAEDKGKGKSRAMASLQAAFKPTRPPARVGILGVPIADEDADGDYAPGNDEGSPSPRKQAKARARDFVIPKRDLKRKFSMQSSNAEILDILQPALLLALQLLLERKSPQLLIPEVMGDVFLNRDKVATTKLFRAIAVQGGISAAQIGRLLQMLYLEESTRTTARLVVSPRPNAATTLHTLHLQAFTRLTSSQLTPLFVEATNLENICLRGCLSVSAACISQLVESSGKTLRNVNLNWTSVGPAGLSALVHGAPNIEVLKVAHVRGLSTAAVTSMMSEATEKMSVDGEVPLGNLRKLKVTGCEMSMAGVVALLEHSGPQLQSLDIGGLDLKGDSAFGGIKLLAVLGLDPRANHTLTVTPGSMVHLARSPVNSFNTSLEKLSLAGAKMDEGPLLPILAALPRLRAIKVVNLNNVKYVPSGAPGRPFRNGMESSLILRIFGALNLHYIYKLLFNDAVDTGEDEKTFPLAEVCSVLRQRAMQQPDYAFERVGVASSATKTPAVCPSGCGMTLPAITLEGDFAPEDYAYKGIKSLDLSGLDLTGYEYDDALLEVNPFARLEAKYTDGLCVWRDGQSEVLQLVGSKLEDEYALHLGTGHGHLRTINLDQAILSQEAIDEIIDRNPFLEKLDLTACRSIPVRERRNYLELRRKPDSPENASTLTSPSLSGKTVSTLSTPSPPPS